MNRKERVKVVHDAIDRYSSNEAHFNSLYALLLEEFSEEYNFNSDMQSNNYLNNLRQTKDKEARTYIETKRRRPKRGAPDEYKYFISAFKADTSWATH